MGRENRTIHAPGKTRRVVVLGAGPAGLEAALRADSLGHKVRLLERSDTIGGALRLAAVTPPLQHLQSLVSWYEREIAASGVEVRTAVDADIPTVLGDGWGEVVIVATGAATMPPVINGYELLPSWTLEDLLQGLPSSLGTVVGPRTPIVVGGGQRAMALALYSAAQGARPTLVAPTRPGADASGLARRAFLARLAAAGISIVIGSPAAVASDGVNVTDAAGTRLIRGDGVLIADPVRALPVPGSKSSQHPVVVVGDARVPRGIGPAIAEGRDSAARLDELVV